MGDIISSQVSRRKRELRKEKDGPVLKVMQTLKKDDETELARLGREWQAIRAEEQRLSDKVDAQLYRIYKNGVLKRSDAALVLGITVSAIGNRILRLKSQELARLSQNN